MPYCSVVPREIVERYGPDFRDHPWGTGPFSLGYWDEGQALVLLRNPRYFQRDSTGRRLPYLRAVKFSFVNSKSTEFLMFLQGQLDLLNDVDPSYKDEILTRQGNLQPEFKDRIRLKREPYLNTEYMGFLVDSSLSGMKHSPILNRYFRQAVNYGIDRTELIDYLRNHIGLPANSGIIPFGMPSFDSSRVKGYHYDPRKARKLLARAGFSAGRGLPVIDLYSTQEFEDLADFVASQLGALGIRIRVDIEQIGTLREQAAKGRAPFFRAQWIADYPDAENYLAMFYSRNPAPPNYTRFHNHFFDSLYEASLSATNDSLRYSLYRHMDRLVITQAPVVPLYYDEVVHLTRQWVHGLKGNPLNLLDLRRVWIHP